MNTTTLNTIANGQQSTWDATLEVQDWRRKLWRVNYRRHVTHKGWCVDWEIIAPNGLEKASSKNDLTLAHRCTDESGLINQELLEYEFRWWVNHYTNTINLKALKASQEL